jgi:hypothetical protein
MFWIGYLVCHYFIPAVKCPALSPQATSHWRAQTRTVYDNADMSIFKWLILFKCVFMNYINTHYETNFHDLKNPRLTIWNSASCAFNLVYFQSAQSGTGYGHSQARANKREQSGIRLLMPTINCYLMQFSPSFRFWSMFFLRVNLS